VLSGQAPRILFLGKGIFFDSWSRQLCPLAYHVSLHLLQQPHSNQQPILDRQREHKLSSRTVYLIKTFNLAQFASFLGFGWRNLRLLTQSISLKVEENIPVLEAGLFRLWDSREDFQSHFVHWFHGHHCQAPQSHLQQTTRLFHWTALHQELLCPISPPLLPHALRKSRVLRQAG
jgi:hypothetical protein